MESLLVDLVWLSVAGAWGLVVTGVSLYAAWSATARVRIAKARDATLEAKLDHRTRARAGGSASVGTPAAAPHAALPAAPAPGVSALVDGWERRREYAPLDTSAPVEPLAALVAPEAVVAPAPLEASAVAAPLEPSAVATLEPTIDGFAPLAAETSDLAAARSVEASTAESDARTSSPSRVPAAPVLAAQLPVVSAAAPPLDAPAAPPVAPLADARAAEPAERPPTLEEQLGVTWLTRAGAGAFLLGSLFFFKYAVDNDWISPWGREALGAAVGAGLIGAGEYIKKTSKPRFVHALLGIGLAVLFVTVWASSSFLHLVPTTGAFVANGALSLLGAVLARRHRGAAILVLSLLAAFLNPVLMSTGEDHTLELCAYLLVVTTVAEVVAIELRFDAIPYVATLGAMLVFGGDWAQHGEAYRAADSFATPIGCLVVFAVAWSILGVLRARPLRGAALQPGDHLAAAARAAVGLALVQAMLVVVRYDAPESLAATSLVIAALASVVAALLDRPGVAVAPLVFAPFGFALAYALTPHPDAEATLAWIGAWALALGAGPAAAGVVRARRARAGEGFGRGAALLAAGPLAAFAALTTGLLAGLRQEPAAPATTALCLAGASAVVVALTRAARAPGVAHAFAVVTAALLTIAAYTVHPTDGIASFLGGAAIWAAVTSAPFALYGGALDDEITTVAGPIIATLGLSLATVAATLPSDRLLRAGVLAGAAAFDAALAGTARLRRGHGRAALGLGGASVALFGASAAFATTGASVTVLWAIIAAGAAALARREGRRGWLMLSSVGFVAALARALFVDVATTLDAHEAFVASRGAHGALAPAAFTNQGAIGATACALALLAAARFTWSLRAGEKQGDDDARAFSRGAAALGYTLLATTLAFEVRHATETFPALPALVDDDAWRAFLGSIDAYELAHLPARTMTTTLVFAVFAAALLSAGFAKRSAFHRWLGLAGLGFAFAKLVLWDVWHVERVHQVILLTGVGALLGLGGFLYARFGRRLVALWQDAPASDQGK